jgi:iron complex outermembrane receptor protein
VLSFNASAQVINGIIKDEQKQPLADIAVTIREGFNGSVSNPSGEFSLKLPKPGQYTVLVSAVGFAFQEKSVTVKADETVTIEFILSNQASSLKEVTVTAGRKAEIVDRTPASVQVINSKEIQNRMLVSPNISNILAQSVPSLGFGTNTTSNTGQTLRGRTPLIMIDGIPQSTPLRNGSRDVRTIDPAVIDRIEVVKGATSMYGNGADGGIINYITKKSEGNKAFNAYSNIAATGMPIKSSSSLGGRLTQQFYGKVNAFDYIVSGTFENTGVFKDGKGRVISPVYGLGETDSYNAFAKLGYNIAANHRLEVMYNYFGSQQHTDYVVKIGKYDSIPTIGIPGKVLGEPGGNRYNHNTYLRYQAKELPFHTSLQADLYLQSFYTVYGYEPVYFENGGQSTIQSDKKGLRLSLNTPYNITSWLSGDIVYGLDVLNDKTGQPLVDGRTWVPDIELKNTAPYLQANIHLHRDWILRAGYRFDNMKIDVPTFTQVMVLNNTTGDYIGGQTINGGKLSFDASSFNAGLRFARWEWFRPFISFSQGFSIIDMGRYVRSAKENDVAKMQIQPVRVNNYEAGFSSNFGWLQFTGSYFISTNKIGASLVQDSTGWYTQQKAPEKTYGYELSLDLTPMENLGFGAAYAYVEGKADKDNNNHYNDAADIYLTSSKISAPKASAYVRYALTPAISIYTQWIHFGDRERFKPRTNGRYANGEGPVNGAGIVNLSGTWKMNSRINLQLGIENLFNKTYYNPIAQWTGSDTDYTTANGMRFQLGVGVKW